MAENYCPQCGGKLEPGQTRCSFCGKDLTNLAGGTSGSQNNNQYGDQTNNQYSNQSNNQYGNQSNSQYGNQSNSQYGSQNNHQYNNQYSSPDSNQYNSQYNNYSGQNNNQYSGQNSNYQDNTANYPYQSTVPVEPYASQSANGLQIAGLVLGIISIVTCCCYGVVGIVFGVAGLVCSILGNKDNKHGVGIAGMVCSIIGIVFGIGTLIFYIFAIASELRNGTFSNYYY